MKKTFYLLLCILPFLTGCSFLGINSQTYNFSSELIQDDIMYLASDSLKGRNTPSPELDSAAAYIAKHFKKCNIQPANGSYFQPFYVGKVSLKSDNFFKISKGIEEKSFTIKQEYVPFEMTANGEVHGSVVFAGYGITAPELNYDDYHGVDVKGKVVLAIRHEPGEEDTSSIFEGKRGTQYSSVQYKAENALNHGAIGLIIVTDPLNHSSLSPKGFPWPSLSKIIPKDALPLTLIDENKIPVIHAGEEIIIYLFGSIDKLKEIQKEIDSEVKPKSFEMSGFTAGIKTSTETNKDAVSNVVGYMEGTDSILKDELVVIGAHYDHVGYKKKYEPGDDYIYNGADDNASGTVGLMAIAREFGLQKEKPKRSILFIAFAGEEKGLFGSEAYIKNPLFPIEKTVAMINMDMIGRNNPDTLYIVGWSRSPDLNQITSEENEKVGFTLCYNYEKFLAQSDHANFFKKKIPFIMFHSGENAYYHKVIDNPETIDFDKIARVSKLAYLTALRIANDNQHYKIINKPILLFEQ